MARTTRIPGLDPLPSLNPHEKFKMPYNQEGFEKVMERLVHVQFCENPIDSRSIVTADRYGIMPVATLPITEEQLSNFVNMPASKGDNNNLPVAALSPEDVSVEPIDGSLEEGFREEDLVRKSFFTALMAAIDQANTLAYHDRFAYWEAVEDVRHITQAIQRPIFTVKGLHLGYQYSLLTGFAAAAASRNMRPEDAGQLIDDLMSTATDSATWTRRGHFIQRASHLNRGVTEYVLYAGDDEKHGPIDVNGEYQAKSDERIEPTDNITQHPEEVAPTEVTEPNDELPSEPELGPTVVVRSREVEEFIASLDSHDGGNDTFEVRLQRVAENVSKGNFSLEQRAGKFGIAQQGILAYLEAYAQGGNVLAASLHKQLKGKNISGIHVSMRAFTAKVNQAGGFSEGPKSTALKRRLVPDKGLSGMPSAFRNLRDGLRLYGRLDPHDELEAVGDIVEDFLNRNWPSGR